MGKGYDTDNSNANTGATLSKTVDELINTLFSTNKISQAVVVPGNQQNRNRFIVEVNYTGGGISGVTEGPNLGFALRQGNLVYTNRIRIVVGVNFGVISIVTMFPI